ARRPVALRRAAAVRAGANRDRAATDAARSARPVLLDGARRHPGDRRRSVRAAAAAERSRHAAFFLADGRVFRRDVVYAQRPLQPARLFLRLGRSHRAAGAAAVVPALRLRVPGTVGPLEWARPVAAVAAGLLLRAGLRAWHLPRVAHERPPAVDRRLVRPRVDRELRAGIPGGVPARRPDRDAARTHAAPVGHRTPAAAMDRVGIV